MMREQDVSADALMRTLQMAAERHRLTGLLLAETRRELHSAARAALAAGERPSDVARAAHLSRQRLHQLQTEG